MAFLSLCLFFAVSVVVRAEGTFTKEEAVHLDNTIKAFVDDMLARQASVYDDRLTKLEARLASVYDDRMTKLETLHQQQNRKIRVLETREKRQRKTIQILTSKVSDLTNGKHFRPNERKSHSQIHETNEGKAPVESKVSQLKKSESLLRDVKLDDNRKTRGLSGFNFRALAASQNVAFTAYLDHDVASIQQTETVKFNMVHLNDGNGYNTYSGVFTVPVSGVYLFTYHWNSHFRLTLFELVVNDVQHAAAVASPVSNHEVMGSQTVIIRLTVGQAVRIIDVFFDGDIHSENIYMYATFAGTLLYST